MTPDQALPTHLVLDREAFYLDDHLMVVALVLPGDVLVAGLFFDGVLLRMLDSPAGEA
jgi:hypothetical protein